jgi:hypothetical protein
MADVPKRKLHLVVRTDGVYYRLVYQDLVGLRTVHYGPWPTVEAAYRAIRHGPLSHHA